MTGQLKVKDGILSRSITFDVSGKKDLMVCTHQALRNRNYELDIYNIEPRLVFIQGTKFRLATGYKFDNKKNNCFVWRREIDFKLYQHWKQNTMCFKTVRSPVNSHSVILIIHPLPTQQ